MTETLLSEEDKKTLLLIARETIQSYAQTGRKPPLPKSLPESLTAKNGAFVTLHEAGQLRGCIGTFVGEGPLAVTIQNMAVAAGWDDPRFSPLRPQEVKDLELEISVLSPLTEIADPQTVEVGKHGVYITKGYYRGVLLPQVATEQRWDRNTFLCHTCLKAGLPPDAWKKSGCKIEVFTAQVFGEKDLK